jgi:titin
VTCIAHLKVNASTSEIDSAHMEPPKFAQPISGCQCVEASPAMFSIVVEGKPPPQVMWFREGHQIAHSNDFQITQDGNCHTLLIKKCVPEDSGIFTCRVMNPSGVAECSAELFVQDSHHVAKAQIGLRQGGQPQQVPAGLTVKKPPPQAPHIIKAPSPLRDVIAGNTTKIVVQIASYPAPRFTWFMNGRQIKPSQRFKVSYEQGIITLVIFNVQPQDSGDYMLRAQNELGDCTWKTTLNIKSSSKVVQLPQGTQEISIHTRQTQQTLMQQQHVTIADVAPTFSAPLPPETTVNERSTARLEANIDATPAPRITWHVNGQEVKPSIKYTISVEGKRSTLLIKNITNQDTGVYTCRAVSGLGEAITSTTLYVIRKEASVGPEIPKFMLPLQNCEAYDGEEVILTCTVTGRPKPEVHWYHNDKNIDKSEDFVISYQADNGKCDCVIVECLPDDQGTFKCIATNEAGQAVTQGSLKVKPAMAGRRQMVQPEFIMPEIVAVAQAAPVENRNLKITTRQEVVVDGEARLETETVRKTEVKTIKKIVKKVSGEPPRFSKPIQPQVVKDGENATFVAQVSGAPLPTIVWLKDKKEFTGTDHLRMTYDVNTNTCTLTIVNARESDIGVYSCRASNAAGRATCTANVVVVPPEAEVTVTEKTVSVKKEKVTVVGEQETRTIETSPQFITQLLPQITANEGTNVSLDCEVSADPQAEVTWYYNGMPVSPTANREILYEPLTGRCSLTIVRSTVQDSGDYICHAVNRLGTIQTRTTVTIRSFQGAPIRVQAQPHPAPSHPPPVYEAVVAEVVRGVQSRPDIAPNVAPAPLTEPCAVISTFPPAYLEVGKEKEAPRFIMPLRDLSVNDGDGAIFRAMYRGQPKPRISWFFNSQPITQSADFTVTIDVNKGESILTIKEVFPDDEGEYMCKAENTFGAAVTHCHLFVSLPSSSDDEYDKLVSQAQSLINI